MLRPDPGRSRTTRSAARCGVATALVGLARARVGGTSPRRPVAAAVRRGCGRPDAAATVDFATAAGVAAVRAPCHRTSRRPCPLPRLAAATSARARERPADAARRRPGRIDRRSGGRPRLKPAIATGRSPASTSTSSRTPAAWSTAAASSPLPGRRGTLCRRRAVARGRHPVLPRSPPARSPGYRHRRRRPAVYLTVLGRPTGLDRHRLADGGSTAAARRGRATATSGPTCARDTRDQAGRPPGASPARGARPQPGRRRRAHPADLRQVDLDRNSPAGGPNGARGPPAYPGPTMRCPSAESRALQRPPS